MSKKILLGLLVGILMTTGAFASVKLGVKDIQSNENGIEYVIDAKPVSFTIGGKYIDEDNLIVTGSAIYNPLALGVDVTYDKSLLVVGGVPIATEVITADLLFRKEMVLSNGLSVVADMILVSYSDATSTASYLSGGRVGLRLEVL